MAACSKAFAIGWKDRDTTTRWRPKGCCAKWNSVGRNAPDGIITHFWSSGLLFEKTEIQIHVRNHLSGSLTSLCLCGDVQSGPGALRPSGYGSMFKQTNPSELLEKLRLCSSVSVHDPKKTCSLSRGRKPHQTEPFISSSPWSELQTNASSERRVQQPLHTCPHIERMKTSQTWI